MKWINNRGYIVLYQSTFTQQVLPLILLSINLLPTPCRSFTFLTNSSNNNIHHTDTGNHHYSCNYNNPTINMPRGIKKENLPTKLCVTCNRPFTWRKKWERCWDEVTTCSKSCNHKRKLSNNNNQNTCPQVSSRISLLQLQNHNDDDEYNQIKNENNNSRPNSDNNNDNVDDTHNNQKEIITNNTGIQQKMEELSIATNSCNNPTSTNGNIPQSTLSENDETGRSISDEEQEESNIQNIQHDMVDILNIIQNENYSDIDNDTSQEDQTSTSNNNTQPTIMSIKQQQKALRKQEQKRKKQEKRAQRQGIYNDDTKTYGQKECDMCHTMVDLLIRCTYDESLLWKMVCGRCWKKASGGVVDGDDKHPYYRYGGLWKNRRRK